MRTEIKKWGNSAALRLPAAALAKAGLTVNSPVEIHAVEGKMVVSAVTTPGTRSTSFSKRVLRRR